MSCKPTYKGVRYNSLEELYNANGVNTQQAQQLYSQYLDTIFPDSEVKDIVYHFSPRKFDKFDVNKKFSNTHQHDAELGAFFTTNRLAFKKLLENKGKDWNNVYSVVLNSKKVFKEDEVLSTKFKNLGLTKRAEAFRDYKKRLINQGYDLIQSPSTSGADNITVFESEQIHILGSKQDIEGFKKFIGNENNAQKTQEPPVRRIPKSKKAKTVLDIGIANVTKSEIESKIQENKDHHKDNCNGIIPF